MIRVAAELERLYGSAPVAPNFAPAHAAESNAKGGAC